MPLLLGQSERSVLQASPIVAGAVVLLASMLTPEERGSGLWSPALVKQVLMESAHRLDHR